MHTLSALVPAYLPCQRLLTWACLLPCRVSCVLSLQFLDFFLKGNLSLEPHPRRKPHDWLPGQGWRDLMKLTELAGAKGQGGTHTDVNVFNELPVQLCAGCACSWQTCPL